MKYLIWLLCLSTLLSCSKDNKVKQQQLLLKGNLALENKEYDLAINYFTNLILRNDTMAAAYNNRGIAYEKHGRYDKALDDYNKALSIDQQFTEAYFNRAKLRYLMQDYDQANEDLEKIRKVYKDSSSWHFIHGLINSEQKNYEKALEYFNTAKTISPDNSEIYTNIATIYYYQDKDSIASSSLDQALSLNDKDPNALNLQALLHARNGDFEDAIRWVNKALQKSSNPYYYNNRGYFYLMTGDLEKGLEDINYALVMDETNPWVYRNKGIYYYKKGNYERAKELLLKSHEMDSSVTLVAEYLEKVEEQL